MRGGAAAAAAARRRCPPAEGPQPLVFGDEQMLGRESSHTRNAQRNNTTERSLRHGLFDEQSGFVFDDITRLLAARAG